MPQGVAVGQAVYLLVECGWEYNDDFYYDEGHGATKSAYTSAAAAERARAPRERQAWRENLIRHGGDGLRDYGGDDGPYGKVGDLAEHEVDRRLAALGMRLDEDDVLWFEDLEKVPTDAEIDELREIFCELAFFEIVRVTLDE